MPDDNQQTIEEAAAAQPETKKNRSEPMRRFTFPEPLRETYKQRFGEDAPKTVALRECSMAIERAATRKANASDETSVGDESLKLCIAKIDGRSVGPEEAAALYERAPKKMRELLQAAWLSMNLPSTEDTQDFLNSGEDVY
jgi:hypothetical protein